MRQIRKALDDDAKSPRYIKTLRGRGYRFAAPVMQSGSATQAGPIIPGSASRNGPPWPITVTVLPFREVSFPLHANSLGEGITALLITYLSTNRPVRVISRGSTMRYKNSDKPVPKIAREVGANRVLEGAVLHSGKKVRITARLINASTDQSEWAGCYEAEMRDWLELQGAVAQAAMHHTALHLDLRLEEDGSSGGMASSQSNLAYSQTFQSPLPLHHKMLDA
jgi:TolB-like protein